MPAVFIEALNILMKAMALPSFILTLMSNIFSFNPA
jgi:hypothetical protein